MGIGLPFVTLEAPNGYAQSLNNLELWGLSQEDLHWITKGTAERVFGSGGLLESEGGKLCDCDFKNTITFIQ